MMNIGFKPTINKSMNDLSIEVHIFDFDENIYDKPITVYPKHFIRGEQKFSNIEALKKQLEFDKINSLT
jgi:riboflavin kinase/FMN adenylyltransferase